MKPCLLRQLDCAFMVVLSACRSTFGSVDTNFGCYFKLNDNMNKEMLLPKVSHSVVFFSILMLSVLQRRLETFLAYHINTIIYMCVYV